MQQSYEFGICREYCCVNCKFHQKICTQPSTISAVLLEVEAEYGDVLYHTEIRWISRGKWLKYFFELRHEIEIFLTEKQKFLTRSGYGI
jgi:hypothetical protein